MMSAIEDKLQELLIDIGNLHPDDAADIAERVVNEMDEDGFFDTEDDYTDD